MKKVILGVGLMIQSACAMDHISEIADLDSGVASDAGTLVPFVEKEHDRVLIGLEKIGDPSIISDPNLRQYLYGSFIALRAIKNEKFKEQQATHESRIRSIIEEKAPVLEQKVELMRRRSPAFSFNQEFEELKSNVKKAQDLAVAVAVSELCNESKIAKRVDLLCAEFSRMKEEVEKGNLQFGMVVGEIKAKFEYRLKGLEDKLKRKLKKHRKQNNKTTAALEEAYQKAFAFIDRWEKREELHDRVIQALSPHSVDEVHRITPIAVRAEHMTKETDWLKKYQTAKEVCDKFNLFADLYESPDLDVVIATKEDLENMRYFVRENSKVKVTMLPEKRQISVHVESAWKGQPVVNVGEWEQLRNLHQEFFGWHPGEWDRNWAEYGVYHLIGLGWDNRYDWDQVPGINAAVARVNAAYAQGYAINTVALTEALKVPFPSDSFNRLVDQFNRFVSLL